MCQWGSQRWSATSGKLWNWTVDHYYNDEDNPSGLRSAYMTSPLVIDSAVAVPDAVRAGDTLSVELAVRNLAGLAHEQVLLGASLWSATTGYIDDPANDLGTALPPGGSAPVRPFEVPAGTPEGAYDLLTALWIDVDEGGAITGIDLPLALRTDEGAVEVCSDPIDPGDGLRVERLAPDSVRLSWDASPNASAYTPYRASAAAGPWQSLGTTPHTEFEDASASAPVLFYEVTAINACGESDL
jgi:hypothetical protein